MVLPPFSFILFFYLLVQYTQKIRESQPGVFLPRGTVCFSPRGQRVFPPGLIVFLPRGTKLFFIIKEHEHSHPAYDSVAHPAEYIWNLTEEQEAQSRRK